MINGYNIVDFGWVKVYSGVLQSVQFEASLVNGLVRVRWPV